MHVDFQMHQVHTIYCGPRWWQSLSCLHFLCTLRTPVCSAKVNNGGLAINVNLNLNVCCSCVTVFHHHWASLQGYICYIQCWKSTRIHTSSNSTMERFKNVLSFYQELSGNEVWKLQNCFPKMNYILLTQEKVDPSAAKGLKKFFFLNHLKRECLIVHMINSFKGELKGALWALSLGME